MDVIAAQLRTSFNARDMDTFRSLIAENARWGDDPDHPRTCSSRDDIIRTYKRRMAEGVRGVVVETTTGPRGVACLVEFESPDPESGGPRPIYQVFLVTEGLITKIEGRDSEGMAIAAISG